MLIDLEELKLYLDIANSDDDSLLKIISEGAIEFATEYCDNIVGQTNVEEIISYEDIDDNTVFLSNTLALEITTVSKNTSDDYSPSWEALTSDDYIDFLTEGRFIMKTYGSGEKALKFEYKAGYTTDDLPNSLKLALFNLVGNYWNKRKSGAVSNESLGDANITWKNILNPEIKALFKRYKKYEIYV